MFYTGKGDGGTSGLYGTNERLAKSSLIYDALGSVDELNSLLGLYRARTKHAFPELTVDILRVQEILFILQAELAGAPKFVTADHVRLLEDAIERIECSVQNPHAFTIPGCTEHAALFDHARAVARRAERAVVKIQSTQHISENARAYLNRLSSFLYVLARYAASKENMEEKVPSYGVVKTTHE